MTTTVGQRIKALRAAFGLSQEDLARRTGVTRGAVSQWETSDQRLLAVHLAAVAEALGITADELLSEDQGEYAVKPTPVRLCVHCAHLIVDDEEGRQMLRHLCGHPELANLITGAPLPCNRHNGSLCGRDGAYFSPDKRGDEHQPQRQMMTAYFEHESLGALQAACHYITNSCLAEPGDLITAHEASPGVAVVRHPDRALVMLVIGRMADTDHCSLVGVEWSESTEGGK